MDKYIYIFHHTDLDGMGVKILGMLYAMEKGIPCKTIACSYSKINPRVCEAIKTVDHLSEVIIGDISVNEETADRLDDVYQVGIPIRLRDHHDTATWLNKYEWSYVAERDNGGIARCGTWWLAQDSDMKHIAYKLQGVINAIDQWDTWKWKETGLAASRKLNSLLDILGEDEFTQYIIDAYNKADDVVGVDNLFDERMEIMLDTHNRHIAKLVETCERFLYTMNLWVQVPHHREGTYRKMHRTVKINAGMIFLTSDLSEVADAILDNHPDLDLIMIVAFPGLISWRTQKHLPVSLGKIAKRATGKGGGHPQAAGSVIEFEQFKDAITAFMEKNFSSKMDFSNLMSPQERAWRAEKKRMSTLMNLGKGDTK